MSSSKVMTNVWFWLIVAAILALTVNTAVLLVRPKPAPVITVCVIQTSVPQRACP